MPRLLLLRPHTHAGKALAIGDTLDVSPSTADWLIGHGIARVAEDAPTAARSTLEKDYELPDGVAASGSRSATRIKDTK